MATAMTGADRLVNVAKLKTHSLMGIDRRRKVIYSAWFPARTRRSCTPAFPVPTISPRRCWI